MSARWMIIAVGFALLGLTFYSPPLSKSRSILVGMPYAEAKAIASETGYELGDTAKLEMVSASGGSVQGFTVGLTGNRGLLVFRGKDGLVSGMSVCEQWMSGKARRKYRSVESFELESRLSLAKPREPAAKARSSNPFLSK